MTEQDILIGAVLEETCLTLEELAGACSVSTDWVIRHVEEGILPAVGADAGEWRFGSRELHRVQLLRALERDFDAVPELAGLVADLLDELDALRLRLRHAGLD